MSDLVEMDYRSVERAKRAKPLPLDASWATGDENFDARIHASLMQRDELLAALKTATSIIEQLVPKGMHHGVVDLALLLFRSAIAHAEGKS